MSSLCIVSGKTCWVLYVDALVLNMDGSVLDALSMAAKARSVAGLDPRDS
jgi:exosome complex component RRP42